MSDEETLAQLRKARKLKYEAFRASLLEDNSTNRELQKQWLDDADSILERSSGRKTRIVSAVILLALIAVTILIGDKRMSHASVVMDLKVKGFTVGLHESNTIKDISLIRQLAINRLDTIVLPGAPVQSASGGTDGQDLLVDGLSNLNPIHLSGGRLSIHHEGSEYESMFNGTPLSVAVTVIGPATVVSGDQVQKDVKEGDVEVFYLTSKSSVESSPVTLSMTIDSASITPPLSLRVTDLQFFEWESDSVRVSTLNGGKIKILDTNHEIEIDPDEFVNVPLFKAATLKVFREEEQIRLRVEAEVDDIMLGQNDLAISAMPSYLEYFYYNQKVGVLWAVALFICSVGWAGINTFFTKEHK